MQYPQFVSSVQILSVSSVKATTQTYLSDSIIGLVDANNNSLGIAKSIKGFIAFLDITAVPGVDTVNFQLQIFDETSGQYVTQSQSSARATTGTVVMQIYPGIAPVAAGVGGVTDSVLLTRKWRLRVVHSAGSNFTYSVGIQTLN